ncbi:MAG TPA: hypothetical protein DCF93_09475, partial [Desulfuromonas sp.]|nr:hypothetical protein [Desulfuromonas sp.]
MKAPVVLMILDGWGIERPGPFNAVTLARTPRLAELFRTCPATTL